MRRRIRKRGADVGTTGGQERSYRCGTPSLEEWDRRWKFSATDPDVTSDEYDTVWNEFEERLLGIGKRGYSKGCDFYFQGDNHGDRTQYLEIVNPEALTMGLIGHLQRWLKEPRYRQWRIIIITYVAKGAAPMVYPEVIRLGREYDGVTLADALADIVMRIKRGERV